MTWMILEDIFRKIKQSPKNNVVWFLLHEVPRVFKNIRQKVEWRLPKTTREKVQWELSCDRYRVSVWEGEKRSVDGFRTM